MELSLSQNIRRFRKGRHLTQDQLAEIMGVTLGAVYKWESGQSTPDLALIVKMADFFGISTDVLIGYHLNRSNAEKTLQELKQYRTSHQYEEATPAVQKALQNYPNHFGIIYECALFLGEKAAEKQSRPDYEAALVQLDRACELIDQNTDESISELTIRNQMAQIHFHLGHTDTCIEILKRYNFCGINNAQIGCILSDSYHRTGEARTYLEKSFAKLLKDLDSVVIGFTTIFWEDKDYETMISSLEWLRTVLRGGESAEAVTWSQKYECVLLALEAEVFCRMGMEHQAKDVLKEAATLAMHFDVTSTCDIQMPDLFQALGATEEHYMAYGETALMATERRVMTDAEVVPRLPALWGEVKNEVLSQ